MTAGLVNVHYPVITGFLILYLAPHGNSGPAAFTAYAGFILFSRFFLGKLPDRIRPDFTFYGGLILMAVGLVVLAAAPGPMVAAGAAAVLGFGFSLRVVVNRGEGDATGAACAPAWGSGDRVRCRAFYDLFVGVSSFAAGAVAKRFGYQAAFAMGAAAIVVAAFTGRMVFYWSAVAPAVKEELSPVT